MQGLWGEYAMFLAGLLAVINPLGAVPVFVGLTGSQSDQERAHTSAMAAVTVMVVLGMALLFGELFLQLFGISVASFRVGGGLLVLLIAISMMQARMSPAKQTQEEVREATDKATIAVVPVGVPLLAGPGAISTIILFAHRDTGVTHYLIIGLEIALVAAVVWAAFRYGPLILDRLGRTGINVVTRIMGLIMAAIGVEFIANGLRELLPGLAG